MDKKKREKSYKQIKLFVDAFFNSWTDIYDEYTTGEMALDMLPGITRMMKLVEKPRDERTADDVKEIITLTMYHELMNYVACMNERKKELVSNIPKEEMLEKFKEQVEKAEKAKEPEEKMEETNSIVDILNDFCKDMGKLFKDDKDNKED